MLPHNSLPQEWPDYLHDDAEIQPSLTVPPASSYVLNFTALEPVGFEQFCWWLLRKHHRLVGCKRLGGPGLGQGGIDLLAFDHAATDTLIVFECKSGQGFSVRDLTAAMEKFYAGPWMSSTREFYLVLAKYEIRPDLAERWKEVKKDLRERGIHGALWTAHTLTAMVQGHPDVLAKFFPAYPLLEQYGNKWMQRVAFHEAFSKAFFDPREHVRASALALVQQGEPGGPLPVDAQPAEPPRHEPPPDLDDAVRQFDRKGHNWSYKGPWFSISAFLPGAQFSHPSAAINFNIPNLAGLTLALSGRWLHDQMLFREGAPVTHEHRGFVIGPAPGLPGLVIDLSSARLRLPEEVVEELASVADELSIDVNAAYLALESKWGASGFPFVTWAGDRVAIGVIDRRAWQEIMAFARMHDFSKGDGPWHMFDASPNVLKPYVTQPERHGSRFDPGYHGIFYASTDVDVTLSEDQFAILWQPNDRYSDTELSERGWWSCEFALRWLVDELLPEVRRWVSRREFPSWIGRLARHKRLAQFEGSLEKVIQLHDLRHLPLLEDRRLAVPTIEAIERLQSFFNAAYSEPHVFVDTSVAEALYAALALLARLGHGHIEYVAGNLSLRESPDTHAELETSILSKVREQGIVASVPVVDYALRAALELMPGDGTPVPPSTDDAVRDALVPLARIHDDAHLARRHQPLSR
jgi:hypothetical protein